MRKLGPAGLLAVVLAFAAGCSGGSGSSGDANAISGDITVLTNRTDIVDSIFTKVYKPTFEAKYPGVHVKFEAITNYEDELRIRMNTKDYGDVLLIPNSITADQLPTYFEPLGKVADLAKKYRFVTEQAFEGTTYGLAITGNAQGFVYNRKIWQAAGVTEAPKTPADFVAALQAIKAKTPSTPLYTNYKDGWPLTQWEGSRGAVSNDPDAVNKLAHDDAPWAQGKEHNTIDSLLYDVVKAGLTETDPTTTNWENSKKLLGDGKIATMNLGSWSIVQMQQAAGANSADIGYLPFPVQVNGKFHSVIAGDYKNAVNVNSAHKAAARAWVDWFADESNYASDQGGIPPLLSGAFPTTLADFKTDGVEYLELKPAPKGEEGLTNRIDTAAEIGLLDGKYRQRIVDAARGAKNETKDAIFADLNKKWSDAKAKTK